MKADTFFFLLFVTVATTDGINFEWFSTKAPYPLSNIHISPPQQCHFVPLHYNLVARHGSREPTNAKTIEKFKARGDILRNLGSVTTKDEYKWLKDYETSWDPAHVGQLSIVGEKELFDMGIRLKRRFPKLFVDYSPNEHSMRSTQVDRAAQSGAAFASGLWYNMGPSNLGRIQPFSMTSESKASDPILRPFQMCTNYVKVAKEKNATYEGDRMFERVRSFLVEELSNKLGVPIGSYNISAELVDSIYSECTYIISTKKGDRRLCDLIAPKSMFYLDYAGDLKEYYTKSYPRSINWEIGEPLLQDLFDTIDNSIAGNGERSNLRFAHAETIMPLAALLGLQRDEAYPTADWSDEQIKNRKWKGSHVTPFAANIAFITYNCSASSSPRDYRVQLLQNEVPIAFPGCESPLCPLQQLRKIYQILSRRVTMPKIQVRSGCPVASLSRGKFSVDEQNSCGCHEHAQSNSCETLNTPTANLLNLKGKASE
ncbi:histidine acid phosphatase-like protein [Planoprotostelium fungivorum]|uniref:Multiple inositol polyphosphate phosphatase 1 n=1 Tax=Planoprotostelium fungivorum TaxID=1890364 RepID=A0A2P6NN31_9EUKA|nr:histidine acid phosphatase-like protein [Planoprotostelium fungivorum]